MTAYSYKKEYEREEPQDETKKPFVSIAEYLERERLACRVGELDMETKQ